MFWYLLIYFIIGIIAIYVSSKIAINKLHKKGFDDFILEALVVGVENEWKITESRSIFVEIVEFIIWPLEIRRIIKRYKAVINRFNKKFKES